MVSLPVSYVDCVMHATDRQLIHAARIVSEETRAALVNLPTGAGKTFLSLLTARDLGAKVILIIAPLNTLDGWKIHTERILLGAEFIIIDSKSDNYNRLRKKVPGVYFITKDYLAISGTSLSPRKKKDGTFTAGRAQRHGWMMSVELVIVDESHTSASNRDTAVYKVLRRIKAKFRIAMSATPAGNKFHRLWETTRWLWPDNIDKSKTRWSAQWCTFGHNAYNFTHKEITGEKAPGAFVKSLPCYITDDEVFKVPVRTVEVSTPMTPKQSKQFKAMLADSLVWIEDNPLVADLPIVQKIRLRQIALGEVTFNDAGEVDFAANCASSKIKACEIIIAKHPGEPLVFYTDSKRFAKVLAYRIGGRAWTGDLSGPQRTELKAQFGKTVPYIVAVIAAFGTGTDGLQFVCNTEVWCNRGFTDYQNLQCEGRLNRRGQPQKVVNRYILTAPDSGDTMDFSKLLANRTELRRSL